MARVIRGARVIERELAQAHLSAAEVLTRAQERAAAVLEEAREAGRSAARQMARAELAAAHVEVEGARAVELAEIRDAVATLALEIARAAVADAIAIDPAAIDALAAQALERVERARRVRVFVHPRDAARLALAADGFETEVIEDPSLSPGDCVVKSELGDVDARLSVRFDALARALGIDLPSGLAAGAEP